MLKPTPQAPQKKKEKKEGVNTDKKYGFTETFQWKCERKS